MNRDNPIEIHIFLHGQDQSGVMQQLAEIRQTLGDIKLDLDTLITKVTDENTLVKSVAALLAAIKTQLDAAIAAGVDPAKLQTLSDLVDAGAADLTAAITANTPSA